MLYEPSIDLTQGSDALGQKACLFRRTELGSGGTFARRLARMLLQSWTKDARCMRGLLFFLNQRLDAQCSSAEAHHAFEQPLRGLGLRVPSCVRSEPCYVQLAMPEPSEGVGRKVRCAAHECEGLLFRNEEGMRL